jgi:hypothetical protein
MTRAVLGGFTVDTERDAELIALFVQAKATGHSQSDLFREMGRVYIEKSNEAATAITYMLLIIDELAEMKKMMRGSVIAQVPQGESAADGMERKKHDRLRRLGVIDG